MKTADIAADRIRIWLPPFVDPTVSDCGDDVNHTRTLSAVFSKTSSHSGLPVL
jgi:hypothetical protein